MHLLAVGGHGIAAIGPAGTGGFGRCAHQPANRGIRRKRQDSTWRRLVSRGANRLRSRLTGDGITDTGCSLKVMTGLVADTLPFFHGAHRFMPALAQLNGFRVTETAVSHRPRVQGETKYGSWGRLKATLPDLLGFLWLKSRYPRYVAEEM